MSSGAGELARGLQGSWAPTPHAQTFSRLCLQGHPRSQRLFPVQPGWGVPSSHSGRGRRPHPSAEPSGAPVLPAALRPLLECTVAARTAAWSPGAPKPLQRRRLKFELGGVCGTAVGFRRKSWHAAHLFPQLPCYSWRQLCLWPPFSQGTPAWNAGYEGLLPCSQL